MRFLTPPTLTPALTRVEKPIAQSLDDIKLRIMRLEQTVEDHARVTTATLYKAKELWKPTWMPVEADGLHYSPDRTGWYLVTLLNEPGQPYVESVFYDADDDCFDGYEWTDIKAWAEMPKPFTETK